MRVRVDFILNMSEEELDFKFDSMWNGVVEEITRVIPMYDHCIECRGDFCGDYLDDILYEVMAEPEVSEIIKYRVEKEEDYKW